MHVTANANQPASGVRRSPAFAVREAEAAIAMPEPLDASVLAAAHGAVDVRSAPRARQARRPALAGMTWTDGGCDSLVLVEGALPTADTDVTVSAAGGIDGVQIGSVGVAQLASEPPAANTGAAFPSVLRVVGVTTTDRAVPTLGG